MTALHSYTRLECIGLWRPTPKDQRREAVVQLGTASLTILDSAGRPLAHWSLAAVDRVGLSDAQAVIYRPHPDASDTLEIDDATMIAALDQIHTAVHARSKPPRKWGRWATLGIGVAACAIAALYAARVLPGYAAAILPDARAAELSVRLTDRLTDTVGPACQTPESDRALRNLTARLDALGDLTFVIVPSDETHVVALPAGHVVVPQGLLAQAASADVLAGHILVALSTAWVQDPAQTVFQDAGLLATARYVLGGQISDRAINNAADTMLTRTPTPLAGAAATLLQGFDALGVSASPFAGTAIAQLSGLSDTLKAQDPHPAGTPN
ncbi:MAG: hypothetical protein AAF386_04295, partial [Pseudomonadota bacterium]